MEDVGPAWKMHDKNSLAARRIEGGTRVSSRQCGPPLVAILMNFLSFFFEVMYNFYMIKKIDCVL